jgi:hypothetical protein
MAKYTRRQGREFWEQLILEFEQTQGVTQRAFAEMKGVNVDTFRQWIYRFRHELDNPEVRDGTVVRSAKNKVTNASFVELKLDASPLVTVRFGAVAMEFSAVPPPAWVAELAAYGGF